MTQRLQKLQWCARRGLRCLHFLQNGKPMCTLAMPPCSSMASWMASSMLSIMVGVT